jgi:hypothetical protein
MDNDFNAIATADKGYIYRSYRGVPEELWQRMWQWAVETGNTGGNIKKANKVFAKDLNALNDEIKHRITGHAYEVAINLFEATNSIGLADKVMEYFKK